MSFGLDRNIRIVRGKINSGDPVVIVLPRPPSLNSNERNGKGNRYSSKGYKEWKVAAGHAINAQRPHRFTAPVVIEILVEETNRLSDIDNRIKPVCDLLQEYQIIPNDNNKFVRGISAYWSKELTGAQVTITEAA